MNWLVMIIGITFAVVLRMTTADQIGPVYPSIAVAFATGILFDILTVRKRFDKMVPKIDPKMITLRRMAIRLRYLAHEGTLSQSGDVVRFDAPAESASEFMDAIMAIVEAAE